MRRARRNLRTVLVLLLGAAALLLLLAHWWPSSEPPRVVADEPCVPDAAAPLRPDDATLAGREPALTSSPPPPPPGEAGSGSPPEELVVRVLDAGGQLVPRVKVMVETEGTDGATTWPATDVIGGVHRYPRSWLDRFEKVSVRAGDARDEDGRPLNLQTKVAEAVDLRLGEVTLQLEAGRQVTGRVVDERGTPVPNIRVRADRRKAETDSDGSFVLAGLPVKALTLRVERVDPWQPASPVPLPLGQQEVEVRLTRGVALRVLVLDPEGKPVGDVPVELGGGQWRTSGTTDPQGVFVGEGAPLGTPVRVYAWPYHADLPWPAGIVCDVDPAVGEVTVQLEPPVVVEGELVYEDGEPVLDGSVSATSEHGGRLGPGSFWKGDGTTNRFVLPRLPHGPIVLRGYRKGASHARPEPVRVDAPAAGVRIVFGRSADLRGRVLNEDRRSLAFAFTLSDMSYTALIRPDGSFEILGLPDRPGYIYAIQHETGEYFFLEDVKPSDGPFEVTLVPGNRYEGRVEGHRKIGRFGPGVICTRGGVQIYGRVRDDGTFLVLGVPPGRWDVELWHDGTRLARLEGVEENAKDLVLVMPDRIPEDE